jgi:Short C-terminal domain
MCRGAFLGIAGAKAATNRITNCNSEIASSVHGSTDSHERFFPCPFALNSSKGIFGPSSTVDSSKNRRFEMKNSIMLAVSALLLASVLSGCFSFRGGDETVIQQRSPSTERELADLKAAYDRGIISQQEYNQQRDRLMGR